MGASILPSLIGFSQSGGGTGAAPGPLCAPCWIAVLFFWPVLGFAAWAVIDIARMAWAAEKQYAAWKKTLTPEQLMAVLLAEAVGLALAAHELHKHNNTPEARARRQRIRDQIVHGGF